MSRLGTSALPRRIFVLEDDPVNRRLIELEFEGEGYALSLAGDSQTALDLISSNGNYEVGIFDLRIPNHVGDVPEVEEALKVLDAARSAMPLMSIVTISSVFIGDELKERLDRLRVSKVFSKPFSLNELHQFIDAAA